MSQPPAAIESLSALGLLVLGLGGVLGSVALPFSGLLASGFAWWLWLVPLWSVGALLLGWRVRHRRVGGRVRTAARIWVLAGALPLVAVLGFGKPVQKVMLEKQAAAK